MAAFAAAVFTFIVKEIWCLVKTFYWKSRKKYNNPLVLVFNL